MTECWCRGTPSLGTGKRRRDMAEDDTATSFGAGGGGMLPPPIAELEGRRGSGVGSVTATSLAHPGKALDVLMPGQAGNPEIAGNITFLTHQCFS